MAGMNGKAEILGYSIGIGELNAVQLIEKAGRTCYQSQSKIKGDLAEKFVRMIIKRGHESVLEHSLVTVRFSGCSRVFTHQLVRHRLMAVSQESQRYVDEAGFFDKDYYVIPLGVREAGEETVLWYLEKMRQLDNYYKELQQILIKAKRDGKIKNGGSINEDARFLLPNAVCSEIVVSCNFREWRHIFKLRCNKQAQWEIREVLLDLLKKFQKLFSPVFEDFFINEEKKCVELIK